MESLLFHFLDEWLFLFSAEPFFIARVNMIYKSSDKTFYVFLQVTDQ